VKSDVPEEAAGQKGLSVNAFLSGKGFANRTENTDFQVEFERVDIKKKVRSMAKAKILVIENESSLAENIQKSLESFGYDVPAIAFSGEEALQKIKENDPDLVLVDTILKGKMDGIETAHKIRSLFNVPLIYLTAFPDEKILEETRGTEPVGYVTKPFEDLQLRSAIEMALYRSDMEKKLIQAEKLTAAGKLAATVAHEINNPLQAIDNFISLVSDNLEEGSQDKEYLRLAKEGVKRITAITKQLLTFHHPDVLTFDFININKLVEKALVLTRKQLTLKKIKVVKDLSPDLPEIRISFQQMHHALISLILNAQEAMPDGGELRITTTKDGDSINIEIADTGIGMPKEVLEHIFEPFFTTKKGVGTGLGLSIAYGIVKAYGGDVIVKSKEKEGTSITITLPIQE
jgi:signal transduction histidine kinase